MNNVYDLAIIGGGLAGASLACCLDGVPLRVAVLEQTPVDETEQPGFDDRGLALALSSRRILDSIGVWSGLAEAATPIRHIHVSDQGRLGLVHLHADEVPLPAFAWVVAARVLGKALTQRLSTLNRTDIIRPATVTALRRHPQSMQVDYMNDGQPSSLHCRLLVAADGTGSSVRSMLGIGTQVRDYQQTAIVSHVSPEKPHHNTAYERFTRHGPLALLPMAEDRCVAVHVVHADQAADYLALSGLDYLACLQQEFGDRLGRFSRSGQRKAYPIRLVRAERQFDDRTVLLGNSAHTIHPNGAQGFNLGLRDTAALADFIQSAITKGDDPGDIKLLAAYVDSRTSDQSRVINFTDRMGDVFYNDAPVRSLVRNLGMLLFDASPTLKRQFALRASGLAGHQPSRVRTGGRRL
jgi:2-octaprenyl-6-methoxyphenol hydroxylase